MNFEEWANNVNFLVHFWEGVKKTFDPPPPQPTQGTKKSTFLLLFYDYFVRTSTQTIQNKCFYKRKVEWG